MSITKLASALFGVALVLTACSNGTTTTASPAASQEFNDADVSFAQEMIPHHQQALMMAAMAKRVGRTDGLRQLAQRIQAAQQPEIDLMAGWLDTWGEDVTGLGGMDHMMMGHDDVDGGMPGMMSGGQLRGMRLADGIAFDRLWLKGMIEHHEGAVTMAREEQTAGLNADAIALAKRIETDQTEEIAYMRDLLAQLP